MNENNNGHGKPDNPGQGHGQPENPGQGHGRPENPGHGRPDVPIPPVRPVG